MQAWVILVFSNSYRAGDEIYYAMLQTSSTGIIAICIIAKTFEPQELFEDLLLSMSTNTKIRCGIICSS